ncbi:unnamed protein product [Rotaria sp. Silwood1]|nr:unnamed protein product [Rotaria sp. Silwood1]CAF3421466.1 unnamed protein product [Rotaria sp. Silwood1]CAF3423687.1 unnamed protein product [Rotaria sp. Silwood1]CAF4493431.1 unnamed protein product [Rotaria sp. Silwood1]CAF4708138.1 unnamed protein product [Rotaria sp. Silwood1]
MADGPSSVTTRNQRSSTNSSLPIEYQVRPPYLPSPRESPLTGLATHPYRPRSIWYELWKSKLAFILFVTSTTFIYFDYQRTQRYKAKKALDTAKVSIKRWYIFPFIAYSVFVHKHENLRQDYFRNQSQLVGGMKEPNW